MLEIRKYTSAEMANELGIALTVNSLKSCIKGKLDRLGVEYDYDGRGASTIYEIKSLPDEFKDYCMKHFGCASNTDFQKMREVFFLALNDESYLSKPDTEKQDMSDEYGIHTYRGTIAKYISKLENAGYIGGGEYRYLVVTKDTEGIHHSKEISKERYCNGWKISL